tara:strand:+ start:41951 stop:42334 length:384 start_codon:yes stop_codon:yes gene_type:complete
MSIKSHLEKAEDSARQALINALAEGEDYYLTDLFNLLNDVRELNQKVGNTIRFTDNSSQWESDRLEYNFNLSSDYLNRPGGDMDALDNISFSSAADAPHAAGPVNIPGGLSEDVISFGDYKESRDDS